MLASLTLILAQLGAPAHDYAHAWAAVESGIRSKYYARTTRKAEMDDRLATFGPKAKAAKTDEEFDAVLQQMTDAFGDSHFDYFTRSEPGYYMMDGLLNRSSAAKMPQFGAWFKKREDGYTVQMVLNGSEAERVGLRKGDVILRANDVPFTPITALKGKSSVNLSYLREGKPYTATVAVRETAPIAMFLDATRASIRVIPVNGRRIGYIHVWTLASMDFFRTLQSALRKSFKDTDAVVLDIRDGFGGYALDVTSTIKKSYPKPIKVLINEGSRSAKELLAFNLKKAQFTLIGKRTAGHVLGTQPIPIDGWGYLEIPMAEVPADGVRLEKRGVDPDIEVAVEFDPAGNDLMLTRALELLRDVPIHL